MRTSWRWRTSTRVLTTSTWSCNCEFQHPVPSFLCRVEGTIWGPSRSILILETGKKIYISITDGLKVRKNTAHLSSHIWHNATWFCLWYPTNLLSGGYVSYGMAGLALMLETCQSSSGESHSQELRNSTLFITWCQWIICSPFSLLAFSFPSFEESVLSSNAPNEKIMISLPYLKASLIAGVLKKRSWCDIMEIKKKKKAEGNLVVSVWELKLWNRMFVVVRFPERQMR